MCRHYQQVFFFSWGLQLRVLLEITKFHLHKVCQVRALLEMWVLFEGGSYMRNTVCCPMMFKLAASLQKSGAYCLGNLFLGLIDFMTLKNFFWKKWQGKIFWCFFLLFFWQCFRLGHNLNLFQLSELYDRSYIDLVFNGTWIHGHCYELQSFSIKFGWYHGLAFPIETGDRVGSSWISLHVIFTFFGVKSKFYKKRGATFF